MSRAYTEVEVRCQFLQKARNIAKYWATTKLPIDCTDDVEHRVFGAVFSILAEIDGSSATIPQFKLIPNPHPDDKEYHIEHGENWYPNDVDIAGSLHELFYNKEQ